MKDFLRRLLALSAPIAVQQTVFTAVNLVDNLMIGNLSETSLAAAAVAGQVNFLVLLFLFGVTSGSAILMSQFFGAQKLREIRRSMGLALLTAAPGIAAVTLLSVIEPRILLRLFTPDPEVLELAASYQRIISLSYPATMITNLLAATLRSTREVRLPMAASTIALILNTLGNIVLINGLFGLPRLELFGAGIATFAARWIECGLILLFTLKRRRWILIQPAGWFGTDRQFRKRYFKVTLPVVGNEVFWSIGFSSYLAVFGRISTAALAAYNIQEMVVRIGIIIFIALGNGAAILLGNTLGAGRQDQAQGYALNLLKIAPALAAVFCLASFVAAPYIPLLYNVSAEAQGIATRMLQVLALVFPFKILNILFFVGIFRSGGDTVFAFAMDVGILWAVGIPLAFVAGLVLRVNPAYVYLVAGSEELIKVIVGIARVRSRKWMHIFTTS